MAAAWGIEDVAAWVDGLDLAPAVTDIFRSNRVDGPVLLTLTSEDLTELRVQARDANSSKHN
jgi:hypothetical protein